MEPPNLTTHVRNPTMVWRTPVSVPPLVRSVLISWGTIVKSERKTASFAAELQALDSIILDSDISDMLLWFFNDAKIV